MTKSDKMLLYVIVILCEFCSVIKHHVHVLLSVI